MIFVSQRTIMKIRKIIYTINHIHILTFKDQYKPIIAHYFNYESLRYRIDDENTIHESIRLDFPNEGFILMYKKDAAMLLYEGDIALVKKSNPVVEIFFDIYEKIKKFEGFVRTTKHNLEINAVDLDKKELVDEQLETNIFLKNPFGKLDEYGTIYEFVRNEKKYRFRYGNFNKLDIQKFELSPLKTDYNKELFDAVGFMSQVIIEELTTTSTLSKFKGLINEGEGMINLYTNLKNGN